MYNYDFKSESNARLNNLIIELKKATIDLGSTVTKEN